MHVDAYELIAFAVRVQVRYALIPHAEYRAGLRSGLDRQQRLPRKGRHLDLCAERRLRDADDQIEDHVVTFAVEELMRFFLDHDNNVARSAAAPAHVALSAERDIIAFCNACGNIHFKHRFSFYATFAMANGACFAHGLSFTAARGTHGNVDHLPEHGAGDLPHLAASAAGFACLQSGAAFCAGSFTRITCFHVTELDLFLDTRCDFFQRERNTHLKIGTLLRTRLPLGLPAAEEV